jgi:hypothetical protein
VGVAQGDSDDNVLICRRPIAGEPADFLRLLSLGHTTPAEVRKGSEDID